MGTFLAATLAVTLAEMGDKTQLLAMAFATKYKAYKVLVGVLIATVLNHALAVALGSLIAGLGYIEGWIQAAASLSFIFFGLWTIRGDKLEGEENRKTRFGAVATVSIAFFIAELGDKTQLATIALATKFPSDPLSVLIGTTTGMLIADSIGIIVGVVMCKRIPERVVKLVSAGAFIVFGFIGSYQVMVEKMNISMISVFYILAAMALITAYAAYIIFRKSVTSKDNNSSVAEYCRIKNNEPSHENE